MAQAAHDSIKSVINEFFTKMKAADAENFMQLFTDSAILQTIRTPNGKPVEVRNESLKEFASFIATSKPGDADEQIVFEKILVDDVLAVAWTPYKFYYKGNFSHCGVNQFTLVKTGTEWKINYIIDTRRKTGCDTVK